LVGTELTLLRGILLTWEGNRLNFEADGGCSSVG
jgi:hypothetical protein